MLLITWQSTPCHSMSTHPPVRLHQQRPVSLTEWPTSVDLSSKVNKKRIKFGQSCWMHYDCTCHSLTLYFFPSIDQLLGRSISSSQTSLAATLPTLTLLLQRMTTQRMAQQLYLVTLSLWRVQSSPVMVSTIILSILVAPLQERLPHQI